MRVARLKFARQVRRSKIEYTPVSKLNKLSTLNFKYMFLVSSPHKKYRKLDVKILLSAVVLNTDCAAYPNKPRSPSVKRLPKQMAPKRI